MHEKRHHKREIKDPIERKKEILDKAMELFTWHGYEQTSMRDIARELNISLGLCYRYFDSKSVLFEEAMRGYIEECCQQFVMTLENQNLELETKINIMMALMQDEKDISRYHDFFHKPENFALHEELSFKLCKYVHPYILKALNLHCQKHNIRFKNPDVIASFLTFGQIGLVSQHHVPDDKVMETVRDYIFLLLKSEIIPDE